MATKRELLSSRDKQRPFQNADNSDGRYSCLNLNQNYKTAFSNDRSHSKLSSNIDKKFENKSLKSSWNKSAIINSSSKSFCHSHDQSEEEEDKKQTLKEESNLTSSTLSLHIAAYENSNEDNKNESLQMEKQKLGSIKKWKNAKQFLESNIQVISKI
uniref:Uncharacterized protein n=1 Tax=Panagrolaimus sp. ES5 TaxID=591445 RepID=A0AC34FTY8_9BILA